MNQKSKLTAYLLWFFLGLFGAHKFYLGKVGMGILYLFTAGLFGVGWIIDLFTLGNRVDVYNALHRPGGAGTVTQQQNVVVNVTAPASNQETRINAEKQILNLSNEKSVLTLKEIVSRTTLNLEEADKTIKKLIEKGMAKEIVSTDGKISYDLS